MKKEDINWKGVYEAVKHHPDNLVIHIPYTIPRTLQEFNALPIDPTFPFGPPEGMFGEYTFTVKEIRDKAK